MPDGSERVSHQIIDCKCCNFFDSRPTFCLRFVRNRCDIVASLPGSTSGSTDGRSMALHRLSPLKLKTSRPGRYLDGGGLYLQVTLNPKTGALRRSWVYRFESQGHERRMGLGSLDDVTLQEARERAAAARKLHRDGQDPIEAREAARSAKRLESA